MAGKLRKDTRRFKEFESRLRKNPFERPDKVMAVLPGGRANPARKTAMYGLSMEPQTQEEARRERNTLLGRSNRR
jgi:hypothetical protein